ncbi:ribosomal RNA-processing protein 8 [Manacus vitellinus]|uniref:ribosomal RNA-processing protein 8 n=1 Tax=Manacus vitellinus TaxID=328815 RepID=UPI00115F5D5E|nr:ribosomal RNA-processing protein 8 [Manacus vitellinus]
MAEVPLADESVDVAVFCLALMGTNLQEILGEANRVLKLGGTLMVAEVASRFEDIHTFLKAMAQLGFRTVSKVCPWVCPGRALRVHWELGNPRKEPVGKVCWGPAWCWAGAGPWGGEITWSENGPDGRALSPGKKLCKGSEYGRTLGPCTPSPTTTFGDLRNAKAGQARRRRIPSVAPPPELQDWLRTFQRWSGPEKLLALDELIDRCEPAQIKYMMQVIEPQFQRDFISLLPKELALYVLSFLEPRDLLRAAQTCRYWRVLAEDNLLWREKCREEGIEEPLHLRKRRLLSPGFMYSPWKFAFLRQHRIDMNWRSGELRPPKVLKGHDDHVITCLQFCGNRIVSGSDDNTLKVWSAVTGECVQTLVGHTGGVWSSQMRDSIVISGSTDRTLKVWNADSGECVHTLYGHTSTVRCMHLHGNRVVSGSRDATLRLWDIETGQCLHVLMGHVAAVRCVQYDGNKVVSGAYDYTVKVWDPESESCTHTLQGHTNRVYSLQFDGTHIVSGSLDTSIRVWDVESGNCLHTLMGHQSLTSGMELRDNILVSGNADSTVKIWDIKTGQCLQTLQERGRAVAGLGLAPGSGLGLVPP